MATTDVNYKVKVVNIKSHLNIRKGHGTNYEIIGKRSNGDTFMVDKVYKSSSGSLWYRQKGTEKWSCAKTSSGTKYIKIVQDYGMSFTQLTPKKDDKKGSKDPKITGKKEVEDGTPKTDKTKVDTESGVGLPISSETESEDTEQESNPSDGPNVTWQWQHQYIQGLNNHKYPMPVYDGKYYYHEFPKANGSITYSAEYATVNYSMWNIIENDNYQKKLSEIKKSINAPTAWDESALKKMTYINFNRFKMDFPDLNLRGSKAAIFITRPSLNLIQNASNGIMNLQNGNYDYGSRAVLDGSGSDKGKSWTYVSADVRIYNLLRQDPTLALLLSRPISSNNKLDTKSLSNHNLNPLLSNLATSVDVQDDTIDSLEMGETVTGYKIQYSKHSNKSVAAGDVTVKYKETQDLTVTKLHQVWVDYQSDVYKGVLNPLREYVWKKELDYLCNIYYFLLAPDGETILFWSKYYGCFPQNVPKSSFSFDRGSEVAFPEVSVTYHYIYKEDWSPQALVEFNEDAGVGSFSSSDKIKYVPTYSPDRLHTGTTWVGLPFIQTVKSSDTFGWSVSNSTSLYQAPEGKKTSRPYTLKLRYRKK